MSYDHDEVPFDADEDSMERESLVHEAEASYDVAMAEEASREYVGQWNRLVSRTNWEKGQVISQWRASMIASDVPIQLYSDEAWSRRVGNVSSQHVGRLRRVFERFGDVCEQYTGLYWSHFQAALDWDDAEIWLEGAVQQRWSVSKMRNQRWVAIGAPAELKPKDEEVILSELDEDVTATFDSAELSGTAGKAMFPDGLDGIQPLSQFYDGPGDGDEIQGKPRIRELSAPNDDDDDETTDEREEKNKTQDTKPKRLFEDTPNLPDDLEQAFEMLKLAILNHKLANWSLVPKESILTMLEKLEQLCD